MRELSLFSGAGGGVLGSKLLGWQTVGYIEWEDYCQTVIAQRIKDGIFSAAPIFSDVREFVKSGAAREYRGFVDVVTGGFPCQPFSVAGKRKASDDERNMWPATMEVIKRVQPPIVFLENVSGLLSATVDNGADGHVHYFGEILRDLAEGGYDVKWCVLGADDVGAPHHRKRLWILGIHANPKHNGSPPAQKQRSNGEAVCNKQKREDSTSESKGMGRSRNVADTNGSRQSGSWWAFEPSDSAEEREGQEYRVEHDRRWGIESCVGRVANGVADRTHRLKSIGNGQVPLTFSTAYAILSGEFARGE